MPKNKTTIHLLPTLYGTDKKGNDRVWKVWVDGSTVHKSYGILNMKQTVSPPRSYSGVNIGKKNETTAEEQAIRQAERDWVSQLDKGYFPRSKEGKKLAQEVLDKKKDQGNVNTGIDSIVRGRKANKLTSGVDNGSVPGAVPPILPMLCETWVDEPKCLKYFDFESGVYVQPKLDGIRALVFCTQGRVVMVTRKAKQILWLKHIRDDIATLLGDREHIVLDCEVYAEQICGTCTLKGKTKVFEPSDEYLPSSLRFETITGACRPVRGSPHPLESQLKAYIFDVYDTNQPDLNQTSRFEILDELDTSPFEGIRKVDTQEIFSQDEISEYHDRYVEDGYEGVVLRSKELVYKSGKRSLYMRKYKDFMDSEFEITGIECDDGVDRDQFVWLCTNGTRIFRVKPMGTREQKYEWYENSEDYIGKQLTVRYQEVSSDGDLRFARGTSIRDYE